MFDQKKGSFALNNNTKKAHRGALESEKYSLKKRKILTRRMRRLTPPIKDKIVIGSDVKISNRAVNKTKCGIYRADNSPVARWGLPGEERLPTRDFIAAECSQ